MRIKTTFLLIFLTCESFGQDTSSPPSSFPKPLGLGGLMLFGPIEKKMRETELPGDRILCENWKLSEHEISKLLQSMELVTPEDWYSSCYMYPCYYKGTLTDGNSEYKMIINAASHIMISNEKETFRYINRKKSDHFIVPCNCCEEDE